MRNPQLRIPLFSPLEKGSCEKIQTRDGKASPLVPGREKFTTPKPAGATELRGIPSSSAKRRRQSGDSLRKTKGFSFRFRLSSIPCRRRRNQRLFGRGEFSPPLDMVKVPNFPAPEFFHRFGEGKGFPEGPFPPISSRRSC